MASSYIDNSLQLSARGQNLPSSSYKAKLIKESFGDRFVVELGQTFKKVWTFKNECEYSWPADLCFKYTNGQLMGQESVQIQ